MANALIPRLTAILIAASVVAPLGAVAQQSGDINFPQYLNTKRQLAPPFQSGDKLPLVRGNQTYQVEGSTFVTPTGPVELQNKSLDCNKNTCVNFPGIPPSSIPDCATGEVLTHASGIFTCTAGGGGPVTTETVLTADDGSTSLTADDGATVLTAN